ncbi:fucose mutarotase isoform X1 [Suricata suricatta]|uniref:fucose mutarotase isoform X1 n=1 Tax=Suricata suricatta TaxID=37032 RepID=UPI001155354F|nr:fucose mutarotase isoform X1 [Suricata suricatta]
MVVLKGVPALLSPELLYALARMGHGDEIGNRSLGGGPSPCLALGRSQAVTRTATLGPGESVSRRPASSPTPAFVGSAPGGQVPSSGLRSSVPLSLQTPSQTAHRWEGVWRGRAFWRFVFSWGRGPRMAGRWAGLGAASRGRPPWWVEAADPSSAPILVTTAVSTALGNSLSPPPSLTGGVGEGSEQATGGLRPPTKLKDGLRGTTDPPKNV